MKWPTIVATLITAIRYRPPAPGAPRVRLMQMPNGQWTWFLHRSRTPHLIVSRQVQPLPHSLTQSFDHQRVRIIHHGAHLGGRN